MPDKITRIASLALLIAVLLAPCGLQAQSLQPADYQSYLAHIAAANGSLRLNENSETTRWLASAPEQHRGWEWHFLSARSDNSLDSTTFADTLPTKLTWSPDGRQIILPMSDGSIRFLDAAMLTEDRRLVGHTNVVYAARMHAKGILASCSRDGSIRVWDVVTGDSLWAVKAGGQGLADVDFSPDGSEIAYSSWHRTDSGVIGLVSRWNAATGEKIWSAEYGVKPIVVCRYSPDGSKLAIGTWDWRVVVWDLSSNSEPKRFDFDDVPAYSAIDDIAWTPDSKAIISATRNGTPRVWDVESGKLRFELRGHTRPVTSVACSPDGARLLTAGDDGTIKVWNSVDGRLETTLYGHTNEVRSLAVRAADGMIASYSTDKSMRLWDGTYGSEFSQILARNRYSYALPMTEDGSLLASAGPEGSVTIWDANGGLVRNFPALSGLINDAAFSPDGSLIGVVDWDSTVRILDVAAGTVIKELHGQDGGSSGCTFSRDGRHFASGSTNQSIVIWDVATGEIARRISLPVSAYRVEYSRDGKYLAAGMYDGSIRIWNGATYDSMTTIQAATGRIFNLDFSADGWLLAAAAQDGTASVWRLPSGDKFAEYRGHAGAVWDVAFHPDGSRLVTASADLTARMWDTKTGETTLILADFHDPVFNLIFSPDGSRLYVSASGTDMKILSTVPHREAIAHKSAGDSK
jgi:WD40 repeat protein